MKKDKLKGGKALKFVMERIYAIQDDGDVVLAYEAISNTVSLESVFDMVNQDRTFQKEYETIDDFVKRYCRIVRQMVNNDDEALFACFEELLNDALRASLKTKDVFDYPANFNKLKIAYNKVLDDFDPNITWIEGFRRWKPFSGFIETNGAVIDVVEYWEELDRNKTFENALGNKEFKKTVL